MELELRKLAVSLTLTVPKAGDMPGAEPGLPGVLRIEGDMPHFATLEEADASYDQQATGIEDLLHRCLAGGTYDRLVARMLTRAASHFRVPWAGRE